jgi:hypothetical protein
MPVNVASVLGLGPWIARYPEPPIGAAAPPEGQLLVVRARYPSIEGVRHRISMRQYRETYLDLQATPTAEGKFFVQDAGADGIVSARRGSGDVDVLYEDGVRGTLFNGDVDGQSLTRASYDGTLTAADAEYARLLKLLMGALQ